MLQSTVKQTMGLGFAGQIAKANHAYLNTVERIIVDDVTRVGTFVQSNGNKNEATATEGVALTGNIIGVVVKNDYRNNATDTDLVLKGTNQTIIVEGNCYIETSLVANQDQYVFINDTTGAVAFNDTATLADHTYTGWRVEIGNATATAGIIEITTSRG